MSQATMSITCKPIFVAGKILEQPQWMDGTVMMRRTIGIIAFGRILLFPQITILPTRSE
jgi:hypothetical protein